MEGGCQNCSLIVLQSWLQVLACNWGTREARTHVVRFGCGAPALAPRGTAVMNVVCYQFQITRLNYLKNHVGKPPSLMYNRSQRRAGDGSNKLSYTYRHDSFQMLS